MPGKKHRATLLGRLILSTAVCGVAAALLGPARADDANPDTKTTPDGVSVPDSPGASDRLDKAHEKEMQKQWKTAAELYQEALAKYSGRVVLTDHDPDRGIFQYTGIAPVIQERIAKWPAEGLAAYRVAYGATAADQLGAVPHGNIAGLEAVFWNYFSTDAGKTAGLRLIDADLERGDFQAAKWIGHRLLNLHPNLTTDRGTILYRTAVAHYRAGELTQAQALLDKLKQNPGEVGSIGGKDVSLVDSLTAMLAITPPTPSTRPSDADTYPSFGGLGGRGDISTSTARPGASLKSIPLTKPEFSGLVGPQRQTIQQNEQATISNNLAMGIMPVVDAGSLFFQDGRNLYAVDADSGAPLPGWLNTYGGERVGRYKLSVPGRVRNEPLTITVTPSAVLAVMGQPDRMSMVGSNNINPFIMPGQQQGGPPSTVKLVCLDRDTGKELWVKTPAELPEPAAAIRTGSYDGTPLFIPADLTAYGEDSVVAIARGGRENQFDDCYAICLSLKTGQYKWSTYLGSSTRSIDLEGNPVGDPAQAALANGRIFVMTNLGSVASLDPADGRIIWLSGYSRDAIINPEQAIMNARRFNNGLQVQSTSSGGAWAQNPVFVSDGYVFALPRDTKQLFVYDADTGVEKRRIPMSAFDNSQVLLGVRDGGVCLTSDKFVYVVDWKKYQEGDQKLATRWRSSDVTHFQEHSDICGRGFLTADSIYLPTKNRLIQMTWKSGKTVQNYPHDGSFNAEQGPGNLLVTAHDVIVAGQTHVDVYTDLALVRQRFETAIAAAPNDPEPRMGYADALFAGGDIDGTLAHVDQAINLLGGLDSMRSGPDRERVFNTMLHYADQSDKNKGNDPDKTAWEDKFYDRAKLAAETPVENARYRLARAHFDHLHGDYAGEIQLCQEILSDDAMRSALVADDTTAGTMAEAAIDATIAAHRSAYDPVEQKAADALTAARAANDSDQLLAVATIYPNSRAAADARADTVHRFEADNQPDKAITVLRRMYASAAESGKKADLLVSMTNDFLAMPNGLGPALDRLCRAARIAPSTTITQKLHLPDGTVLTNIPFADAVMKLRQIQSDQDNAQLPDFHLTPNPPAKQQNPFVPGALPKITDVLAIVHPLHDFERTDQILTWGSAGLCIYPAGATVPLVTIPQVDKAPIAAAWMHDRWMVWTPSDVYQISSEGKLIWDFPLVHLPTMLVSAGSDALIDDAGDGDAANDLTIAGGGGNMQFVNGQRNRLIINGRIIRGGMVVQQPVAPPPPAAHSEEEQIVAVKPGGDRIVISTSTGRLLGLDFRSGQTVWQSRPLDHVVDEFLVNPHFTVVRMDDPGGSQLALYETPTGHLLGRRRYGPDNTPTQLVNVALSEEATMAITLYSQVFVKDLYEPWKTPPVAVVAQSNRDIAPYVGLTQPDQLIVHGGRLACLYDQGSLARGYDLSNSGNPTTPKDTRANGLAVTMRMIGPRLYIQTPNEVWQYNLQEQTDYFEGNIGVEEFIPKVHTVLIGKDYVVSINDPVDRGPAGAPYIRLGAFRRIAHPGSTREWGDFDYVPRISSPSGIMDWTGADGFMYYLSKDSTLHILRGARP